MRLRFRYAKNMPRVGNDTERHTPLYHLWLGASGRIDTHHRSATDSPGWVGLRTTSDVAQPLPLSALIKFSAMPEQ